MDKFNKNELYTGGLAEIIQTPTDFTLSLFNYWMTGEKSLGIAMELLGLPYNKSTKQLLTKYKNQTVLILPNEEETLYSQTLFKYDYDRNLNDAPKLKTDFKNILNPKKISNTLKIILFQTKIISGENAINIANKLHESIPTDKNFDNAKSLIEFMSDKVWPNAISIGYITNFYSAYLEKTDKNYLSNFKLINKDLKRNDWLTKSIIDKERFLSGEISHQDFISEYGLRSDNDYEILEPRWKEIDKDKWDFHKSDSIEDLEESTSTDQSIPSKYKILSQLLKIRSGTRKKVLFYMDNLRILLLNEYGNINDISSADLLGVGNININVQETENEKSIEIQNEGMGNTVSTGKITGEIININDPSITISENTIGVFPNPGTTFTNQFTKCKGIIFLSGGTMSHGSIVAREFNIPAIIDPEFNIEDGRLVTIDGSTGVWRMIDQYK